MNAKADWDDEDLWEAIRRLVVACGGDPECRGDIKKMIASSEVEQVVQRIRERGRAGDGVWRYGL